MRHIDFNNPGQGVFYFKEEKEKIMRKILNGFRYDTEKAILIGTAEPNPYITDHSYWYAGLYVTKRSHSFFIAGRGGPMSRFGHSTGQNEWPGGSDLIPMSREEAREFAERYLEPEDFEKYFEIEEA